MPSPCLETMTAKDLKQIDLKDGDKVGFAKTDFFKNSKETECPINKCELKEVGCKTEYSASILKISQSANFEITVDYNKITKVKQTLAVCLICHTSAQTISRNNLEINYMPPTVLDLPDKIFSIVDQPYSVTIPEGFKLKSYTPKDNDDLVKQDSTKLIIKSQKEGVIYITLSISDPNGATSDFKIINHVTGGIV